jgi:hypothetical protein
MVPGARQLSFIAIFGLVAVDAGAQSLPDRGWVAGARKAAVADAGVRDLPNAGGRSFGSLDDYLRHLRAQAGPVGRPWYREVEPGLYRLERGSYRPLGEAPADRLFTRAQLIRKFGFRQ